MIFEPCHIAARYIIFADDMLMLPRYFLAITLAPDVIVYAITMRAIHY